MQRTLQEWVAILDQIDLPILQGTRESLELLERAGSDVSGAKVAGIVLPDPMLVLRTMRMANSGRGSRFAQPVLTVEHAVMMIGLSASFGRMLAAPTVEAALEPDVRAGLFGVAARASHAAFQARDWAFRRLDMNVEEVYTAALLQELAAMLLWISAPEQMQALIGLYRRKAREEAEREVFGCTLDSLSLELARAWNLPPLIAAAQQPHECDIHVRPRLVSLARKLARNAERGWYEEALQEDIAGVADALKSSLDETVARVHRVAAEVARTRVFTGASPAACWLPLLSGAWPDDEDTGEEVIMPVEAEQQDHCRSAIAQIAAHLDGTLTLNDLMKLVVKGMRDGIKLKRIVFALLTQDRKQLRARFVVGAGEDSPLKQFQFDMGVPDLISKLMEKQQAFWLSDETRPRVQALLGGELLRITEGRPFYVMSVSVHGKTVGMFYADGDDQPLDANGYGMFKTLCTQAASGMAHLAKS